MPTARTDLAVAVVAGKIFALGGAGPDSLDSVEIYNPVANAWASGKSLPMPRSQLAAVAIDGKIYVVGGGDSTHLRLDPTTNTWQTLVPVPTRRSNPVAEAVAGGLYVIGGWPEAGDANKNEVYTLPAGVYAGGHGGRQL